ncbi:hypothetical protein, partial [Staphylococcus aureus]|uniref:hypothetical protein n=1 Tax=Staphylococcus aureus TaxID=1280 RepID=UPI0020BD85EF
MRSAKYKLDDRGPIDGTFELIGFEMGIGRNKGEIVKGIIEEGDPIDLGFIMQVIEGMKFNSKTVNRLVDTGVTELLDVATDKPEVITPLHKGGANDVIIEPAKG